MRQIAMVFIALLLLQPLAVSALSSADARQAWLDAKDVSKQKQRIHADAKIVWAADKTPENDAKVVDTGKDVLGAALDEADAWLVLKGAEAQESADIPDALKQTIQQDVDANRQKITPLRADVDAIQNQLGLGITFLKMIGKYLELVADVARNSGKVWVYKGTMYADTIARYESKLRSGAEKLSNNEEILNHLDLANGDLTTARRNIQNADDTYTLVKLPGTPVVKFAEANSYMRAAQANLIAAQGHLNSAYALLVRGG